MQKIIAVIVCWCWFMQATAQPNINAAEYFIDTDPGFNKATSIPITTPSANITDNTFSVAIGSLTTGVHTLYLRSRSATGRWSITNRFVFYKPSLASATAPANIVKAEYFFDTDPGFGNGTNIPVTAGADVADVSFTANIDALSVGVHTLYLRSKDANGRWSITNKQVLYKPNATGASAAGNIVKAEYFFDTDPGFGNATNITLTPGADVQNVNFNADISLLSVGVHQLFIRSKNAAGNWSVTNRQILYKPDPAKGLPPANITQVEYFIDTDPGIGKAVPIAINAATNIADFVAPINISGLAVGNHRLFIRSRSASGWSITNVYTFPIAATATAPFINVNAITKKVMCARDSVNISYDARGTYNSGNMFNVELSDAAGSFASPVIIGSYTGTNSAIIPCKLPVTLTGGTNFRVRVSSTNPVVTGLAGTDALTIGNRSLPQTIIGPVNVNGTFNYTYNVPAVSNSTWAWIVSGGTQSSGTNTNSIGATWTQPLATTATGTIKLIETNYGCAGDTSTLTATIYKLRTGVSVPVAACKAFGITVNINADGAFATGNTITAQLSDGLGSFSAPQAIGSTALVGNGVNQTAVITATIPGNIPNGTNYHIRLLSSTGNFVGDTSAAINITKPDIGADLTRSKCVGFGYNLMQHYTDASLTYVYYTDVFGTLARADSVDAGTYQVIGTNGIGCKDTATIIITNYAKPNLGADKTISKCAVEAIDLTTQFTTTGLTVSWNTANLASVQAPGVYQLIVTNTNGCKDTAFVTISNYTKPDLGADKTISKCAVETVDLTTLFTTTGLTVNWNTPNPASVQSAGIYQLIVTNTNGCKDTALVTVSNFAKPDLGADKTVTISCTGGTIDITALYNTAGFTGTVYNTANPTAVQAGSYQLIVTSANGCKDTASITVNSTPITTVATSGALVRIADRECTDASGWTHYYFSNGTPTDYSDDVRLLSLKKNGNSIGTIGVGGFQVKVAATIGAGTSRAVKVNSTLVTAGNNFYSMNRYWDITPTTQPTSAIGVRFYYNTQDLTDINGDYPGGSTHAQLSMYKLQGGNADPTTNWSGATAIGYYTSAGTASLTNWVYTDLGTNRHQAEFMVNSLSGGGAGAVALSTMPVTLVSYTAAINNSTVTNKWQTANEVNASHFNVQRSVDGKDFISIGKVVATGNSSSIQNYQFTDVQLPASTVLYYRLQNVDRDGTITYSNTIIVMVNNSFASLNIYPNPVKETLFAQVSATKAEKVTVQINDMQGKVLIQQQVQLNAGTNNIGLQTSHLAKGSYMLIVKGEGLQQKQFIKE